MPANKLRVILIVTVFTLAFGFLLATFLSHKNGGTLFGDSTEVGVNDMISDKDKVTALEDMLETFDLEIQTLSDELALRNNFHGILPPFYTPKLTLSKEANIRCLAIGMYYEGRSIAGRKAMIDNMWAIVNRAVDGRRNRQYKSNICSVLAAGRGVQYESITEKPYAMIRSVVWGEKENVMPFTAKAYADDKHTADELAWDKVLVLSTMMINGELRRTTTANHFISFKAMGGRVIPDWVPALMSVGIAGPHLLLQDYAYTADGEKVYFTKDNPYNENVEYFATPQ